MILKASNEQRKGMKNGKVFRLPFVDDGTDAIDDKVRTYLLCKRGLVILLTFGERRYVSIRNAAMSSAVLPDHKSIGKKNYNAVEKNERKYQPLLHHFEYLKNLGEVRATRVVATLVDGMGGHANRDNNIDVTCQQQGSAFSCHVSIPYNSSDFRLSLHGVWTYSRHSTKEIWCSEKRQ